MACSSLLPPSFLFNNVFPPPLSLRLLSLPLPKRSMLPYIPCSTSHHSSSSSYASREHVRALQNKLFQKSLLIQNLEGLPSAPQALHGTATPTIHTNIVIVLHRPCHQSCGWRKGWLLTTVKPGVSEVLHRAVNISTSARKTESWETSPAQQVES